MDDATLSNTVVSLLITEHDFSPEEANVIVAESNEDNPDLWNENADPKALANFLASEEDDE